MKLSEFMKRSRVAPSVDTLTKINEHLVSEYNKAPNYVQQPSHSPSTFGSACFRKIYYQYYRVAKDVPVDARAAKIFELGKFCEDMVMSWLKALGEHIPYRNKSNGEIPLNKDGSGRPDPQFPISIPDWRVKRGFVDNVAVVNGKLWIYEIKSIKDDKFQELSEPTPDHIVQTTAYFKAFNDHLANGDFQHIPELKGITEVEGVKVIYINKNTSELKLFQLNRGLLAEQARIVAEKVVKANEYIDLKQLPPKTPDKCFFCPFNKKCKKEWNEV